MEKVGNYRVQHFCKKGGMSRIFLGKDEKVGREVLLKLMSYEKKNVKEQEIVRRRNMFVNEARLLRKLNHKGIVKFYDLLKVRDSFVIAMEYVHGIDLKLHRESSVLNEEEVVNYSIQILEILEYLHDNYIVYRDLKPENIMIDVDQKIRLVDFGLSSECDKISDGRLYGTAGYAPKEQYAGKIDFRSDIYSLGVTINYLITGKDPEAFKLHSMDDVGICFRFIVERAASDDILERYQSAWQMRKELQKYLEIIKNRNK
jgi:serine/threonine-protein kinase